MRQVIDPQHVCTLLTSLQNPSFAFLTARQLLHQRRTLILFFSPQLHNFLTAFLSRFHFHRAIMKLIISGLSLVGAAVAQFVSDTSVSIRASSSTHSRSHVVAPMPAPTTYSHNNNHTSVIISTVTVTSTEVRFKRSLLALSLD